MLYTVYKVTNELDGKIYIGAHKTLDINDEYMGSGKYLKRAQEKHGIENFNKEILEVFDNQEEMFDMESLLVNEDFVKDTETYNLKVGGEGGWDYININIDMDKRSKKSKEAILILTKTDEDWVAQRQINCSNAGKMAQKQLVKLYNNLEWSNRRSNAISKAALKYYENNEGKFKGKIHTNETIEKMKESHIGKHVGEKNSQFGTVWIHNLEEKLSKKIKKEELPNWEQDGWLKGRKMKF